MPDDVTAGAITWNDILETYRRLSVQWDEPHAAEFRCGEDVRQRLWEQYVVPRQRVTPQVTAAELPALFGIPIIADENMAPDAWQVRDQSGTVMREGVLPAHA